MLAIIEKRFSRGISNLSRAILSSELVMESSDSIPFYEKPTMVIKLLECR